VLVDDDLSGRVEDVEHELEDIKGRLKKIEDTLRNFFEEYDRNKGLR
jgi:hypothetical protein